MKIEPNNFNPLPGLLNYLDNTAPGLTALKLDVIKEALKWGGVDCEGPEDTLTCLAVLAELGVLEIVDKNEHYEIRVKYGK